MILDYSHTKRYLKGTTTFVDCKVSVHKAETIAILEEYGLHFEKNVCKIISVDEYKIFRKAIDEHPHWCGTFGIEIIEEE